MVAPTQEARVRLKLFQINGTGAIFNISKIKIMSSITRGFLEQISRLLFRAH